VNGTVVLSGPGAILEGRADALRVDANRALSADLNVSTNVTLNNADLDISASTMVVAGDFTVTGGGAQLSMTNGSGALDINGNALFDGGTATASLTNGVITLGGDLTVNSTSSTASFVGSAAHTVIFDGPGPQAVAFSAPGVTLQRFGNLTINNFADRVTFNSDFVVGGTFQTFAGTFTDATGQAMSIGGAFLDGSDGIFLQDLIIFGNLTSTSGSVSANVRVDTNWNLPNGFLVTGNVTLNNADVIVGGNSLTVFGDLTVTGGSAQLFMTTAGGVVDVDGSVLFDGGSAVGTMTNGTLRVTGNFDVQSTSSSASFVSEGIHTVELTGSGAQSISMTAPGTTQQRFNNLTVLNGQFPVSVSARVPVMGTLTGFGVSFLRAGATPASLEVFGTLDLDVATFDGLPLRLESTVTGPSQSVGDVTFQNMLPDEVQLFVSLPGGVNFPASFVSMAFDGTVTFTTGAHLQTVRNPNGGFPTENFVLDLTGATPAGASATQLVGTGTLVIWP
jgi:hypothetical protein